MNEMSNEQLVDRFEELVAGIEVGCGSMSFGEICDELNSVKEELLRRLSQ